MKAPPDNLEYRQREGVMYLTIEVWEGDAFVGALGFSKGHKRTVETLAGVLKNLGAKERTKPTKTQ